MKSKVLHTVWCNISGEAAGEIWNWSGMKVLKIPWVCNNVKARHMGVDWCMVNFLGSIHCGCAVIPKCDLLQTPPAASPELLHHTVWRTWLFIAFSDERLSYYQFSLPHLYIALQIIGRVYFLSSGVKGLKWYELVGMTSVCLLLTWQLQWGKGWWLLHNKDRKVCGVDGQGIASLSLACTICLLLCCLCQ